MAISEIAEYLKRKQAIIDRALREYVPGLNPLFEMMGYSLDGGKRIRPILALTAFEACGGKELKIILPVACALELIHTYSLIHDDLPAMDNDDFRRGKLAAHKKFGEAEAILAGDGLFAYAFELLTYGNNGLAAERLEVIRVVSEAVGPKGVVFGQALDIKVPVNKNPKLLRQIHLNKTAKFIAVSLKCGAIMAQAAKEITEKLYRAGIYLGMLFQYTDDILDITGKKEKLGKTPGKDKACGKLTAPALYDLAGAQFRARSYASRAQVYFTGLGKDFERFKELTIFILNRTF